MAPVPARLGPAATPTVRAYVAVGSSIDPERHVPRGLEALHRRAPIRAASTFYRTPPLGDDGLVRPGDPEFVNGMVEVETTMAPLALRRMLQRIEADSGRVRRPDRCAPRTLDLDLVVHNGHVLDGGLPFRRHLAVCLLEMAPAFRLPQGTPLRDPGGLPMVPAPGFGQSGVAAGPRRNARVLPAPPPAARI